MRRFAAVRTVWSVNVVEALPHGQLLLEIHVVAIREQLVELVLIGSVRPLDFAIELRRPRFDVDVFHAQVRDVPVKQRLELMTSIGSNGSYPKRELLDHIVDEVDGVGLRMAAVHLECANSRGVIDGRVLVTPHRRALLPYQRQELHVHLHVVAGNLLLVPVRMDGAPSDAVRKSVEAMPLADPVDGRVGRLDVVVASEVPDNADRPRVVRAVQDLFNHLVGRLVRAQIFASNFLSPKLGAVFAKPSCWRTYRVSR